MDRTYIELNEPIAAEQRAIALFFLLSSRCCGIIIQLVKAGYHKRPQFEHST